jgi:hypothetical protein
LSEIFDIAGSKALTGAEWIANNYKAYKGTQQGGYASPTALQIARKANTVAGQQDTTDGDLAGEYTTITKRLPDEHLTFQQLDFFTIYNNGKDNDDYHDTRKYSTNKPNFELSRQSSRSTGKRKESHTFKVISSIVKNVSILSEQLNGITTTKF